MIQIDNNVYVNPDDVSSLSINENRTHVLVRMRSYDNRVFAVRPLHGELLHDALIRLADLCGAHGGGG